MSNAVESLLQRLNLQKYASVFQEQNITNPKILKSLSDEDYEKMIPDERDRDILIKAVSSDAYHGGGGKGGYHHDDRRDFSYGGKGKGFGKGGKKGKKGGKKGGYGSYNNNDMYDNFSGGKDHGKGYGKGGGYKGNRERQDFNNYDDIPTDDDLMKEGKGGPQVLEVTVTIPSFTVPFLLANKAQKLNSIHHKYSTTNSRMNKPDDPNTSKDEDTTFSLYGPPGDVEQAKAEIEKLVGIERRNKSEMRFQEALLGRTKTITSLLYALNERRSAQSLDTALASETIPEHVSKYLFCNPYGHIRQFVIKVPERSRSKVDIMGKMLHKVSTCQTLVFCSNAEHIRDILVKRIKPEQLSGLQPQFVHPGLPKEERARVLEEFGKGTGPLDKVTYVKRKTDDEKDKEKDRRNLEDEYIVEHTEEGGYATDKNRFLISTDDYARYARKNPIPYVNLVFCYDCPKTKESYLHRIACCGRGGKAGVAITLIHDSDQDTIRQLQKFGLQIRELPENFEEAIEVYAGEEMFRSTV
eukprot:TRINITY_DN24407_c0_g1_i1.p1 TRINITY_DN24407_c0_g1~~TRINITY_DN24407_c0_g1_i1.p1  ORF type:complete len:525 (+),score=140.11 TRINITY_DN24407_c0_g1_i1:102-1676(+)